ncbi:hypothetical protein WME76_02205 [Sorangium sp. So ce119]|uniref:hypothetical protein n=1 Tax=Sorangium sp. So ce119 TaxID=3133279 RepID=UPI003F5ED473
MRFTYAIVLLGVALLCSACASLPGLGAPVPIPSAEAVGAAMVVAYPGAQRLCVEEAPRDEQRRACVRMVREAFRAAVEVVDGAVDGDLDELADREELGR